MFSTYLQIIRMKCSLNCQNRRSESTIVIAGTKYEEDIWNDQDSSSEDCFF